jgi:plasmid maintenance system killer protein
MKIPTGPEELTPEWLTWALRHRGTLTRAAVESFHAEIIGKGAGFISRVARVNLRYDKAEEGAPASLIAKFPGLDPEMRARAWSWGAYEKDVWFYQELAREISLRAPRHYFSDIDIEAQRSIWRCHSRNNQATAAVLRKAPSLTSVPTGLPERRHRLSGDREGQYAVYLTHPYRLIFEPYHDPIPLRDDGGVDTDRVTSILIIEVVDYHGR